MQLKEFIHIKTAIKNLISANKYFQTFIGLWDILLNILFLKNLKNNNYNFFN
jgi:hypothetical protein